MSKIKRDSNTLTLSAQDWQRAADLLADSADPKEAYLGRCLQELERSADAAAWREAEDRTRTLSGSSAAAVRRALEETA